MKKALLNGMSSEVLLDGMPGAIPGGSSSGIPQEIRRFVSGAKIYDSSCSPEAKVYFIERDNGYYLKQAAKGTLETESKMTAYFYSKGIGPQVESYISDESDWLLTAAVVGEDCVHEDYLRDEKRLCDTLAQELRKLHELDYEGCPVPDRVASYLATAEKNYRNGHCDMSLFADSFSYRSPEEAHDILIAGKDALQSRVLLHGDYCLPNIILDDWKLSGFVDVGCGGVGDRHIDIFWGAWTLRFNLKTDKYRDRFLDAYGRDKVDESLLEVVAAAEVFG